MTKRLFIFVFVGMITCCLMTSLSASEESSLPINPSLMAPASVNVVVRANFLKSLNPKLSRCLTLNLALIYEEEATLEGVNPEIAFVQMLLETAALRFGGQVSAEQNNFAGLGALDGNARGLSFGSPREGIRAQIQHLKYYGSVLPLKLESVNPRLGYIRRGSAPTFWQLAKTWASDPQYGDKLLRIYQRMLIFAQPAKTTLSD